jgi:hypothetical protein
MKNLKTILLDTLWILAAVAAVTIEAHAGAIKARMEVISAPAILPATDYKFEQHVESYILDEDKYSKTNAYYEERTTEMKASTAEREASLTRSANHYAAQVEGFRKNYLTIYKSLLPIDWEHLFSLNAAAAEIWDKLRECNEGKADLARIAYYRGTQLCRDNSATSDELMKGLRALHANVLTYLDTSTIGSRPFDSKETQEQVAEREKEFARILPEAKFLHPLLQQVFIEINADHNRNYMKVSYGDDWRYCKDPEVVEHGYKSDDVYKNPRFSRIKNAVANLLYGTLAFGQNSRAYASSLSWRSGLWPEIEYNMWTTSFLAYTAKQNTFSNNKRVCPSLINAHDRIFGDYSYLLAMRKLGRRYGFTGSPDTYYCAKEVDYSQPRESCYSTVPDVQPQHDPNYVRVKAKKDQEEREWAITRLRWRQEAVWENEAEKRRRAANSWDSWSSQEERARERYQNEQYRYYQNPNKYGD